MRRTWAAREPRRRDQRGAVAVFTALLALTLTIAAGLAVDIGMQRVARTDMQGLADVVALDLSRNLNGTSPGSAYTDLQAMADASRDRNKQTLGTQATVTPELGTVNPVTGAFVPLPTPATVPTAVRVNASTTVPFLFGVASSGGAGRTSVATASPTGCMKIGSTLLDGQLLGVKLKLLSYQGLAGLNLQLGALATELGAGTTDQLLATKVSLGTFLTAVANAATKDTDTTNNNIANILTTGAITTATSLAPGLVTVGQLLSIGSGDDSALMSTVDVLGLVTGAAYVANGTNAVAVPGLSLPTGTTVSAYVTQAPRIACGPRGVATTSQVELVVKQDTQLGLLGRLTVTATVDLGKATGGLTSVRCANGVPDLMKVHVDELTAASITATAHTTAISLLGIEVIGADVSLVPAAQSASGVGSYDIPLRTPVSSSPPVSTGSGTLIPPTATTAQVSLLGLGLTQVSLGSTLTGLSNLITGTIVGGLGLRVAGADLFAVSAGCSVPRLVG